MAESFGRYEFLFEVMLESDEDIGIGGVVASGLVIELPADDRGVVLVMRDDVANQALCVEAVSGRVGVHVLAHAIGACHGLTAEHAARETAGEDLGVLMRHPGWNRISGCAENYLDAVLAHGVDDVVHPCVVKAAVFGFPEAPGGFAHAHDVESGSFHQRDVFVEPRGLIPGHVFVVVRNAVEDGWEIEGRSCAAGGGLLRDGRRSDENR